MSLEENPSWFFFEPSLYRDHSGGVAFFSAFPFLWARVAYSHAGWLGFTFCRVPCFFLWQLLRKHRRLCSQLKQKNSEDTRGLKTQSEALEMLQRCPATDLIGTWQCYFIKQAKFQIISFYQPCFTLWWYFFNTILDCPRSLARIDYLNVMCFIPFCNVIFNRYGIFKYQD